MTTELYKKYRPSTFADVLGQDKSVKLLEGFVKNKKVPHAILFSGPSGCGKTTLARILKEHVGVKSDYSDFKEINAAESRGIDTIREINNRMGLGALGGGAKVWIVDECHQLSTDAQNGFLKLLEDTPAHVYFFLATTNPNKVLSTIRTRCTEVAVRPLKPTELAALVGKVLKQEGEKLDREVVDRVVEVADGSARKALVLLGQVLELTDPDEQMDLIQRSDSRAAAFDLVKELMPFKGNPNWGAVAKILTGLAEEEAEGIRQLVLSVCKTHMLKGGPMAAKAFKTYQSFRDDFYTTRHAGLVAACYEVVFCS